MSLRRNESSTAFLSHWLTYPPIAVGSSLGDRAQRRDRADRARRRRPRAPRPWSTVRRGRAARKRRRWFWQARHVTYGENLGEILKPRDALSRIGRRESSRSRPSYRCSFGAWAARCDR